MQVLLDRRMGQARHSNPMTPEQERAAAHQMRCAVKGLCIRCGDRLPTGEPVLHHCSKCWQDDMHMITVHGGDYWLANRETP